MDFLSICMNKPAGQKQTSKQWEARLLCWCKPRQGETVSLLTLVSHSVPPSKEPFQVCQGQQGLVALPGRKFRPSPMTSAPLLHGAILSQAKEH